MTIPQLNTIEKRWKDTVKAFSGEEADGAGFNLQSLHSLGWTPGWMSFSSKMKKRIHLTRGPGDYSIFVETSASDHYIPVSDCIESITIITEEGKELVGLRVHVPEDPDHLRKISIVLSEVIRLIHENTNSKDTDVVNTILSHIGTEITTGEILDEAARKGLFGELILLERMLDCSKKAQISAILNLWKGQTAAARDFKGNDKAIEVKTSGHSERVHKINRYQQLQEADDEELYLFSVAAKPDSSGTVSLNELVDRVREKVGEEHLPVLNAKLEAYHGVGYHDNARGTYENADPYLMTNFDTGMFRLDSSVDRVLNSSFKGDTKPQQTGEIGYELRNIDEANLLTDTQFEAIFKSMI